MSQHIVRRAGIAGIAVAGLVLTGSGVASATQLPVPASGSTSISITIPAYAQSEAGGESVGAVTYGDEFSARPRRPRPTDWPPAGGCRPPRKPHVECVVTPDAVICRKGCI